MVTYSSWSTFTKQGLDECICAPARGTLLLSLLQVADCGHVKVFVDHNF